MDCIHIIFSKIKTLTVADWCNIFTAIGTVGAVIVALILPWKERQQATHSQYTQLDSYLQYIKFDIEKQYGIEHGWCLDPDYNVVLAQRILEINLYFPVCGGLKNCKYNIGALINLAQVVNKNQGYNVQNEIRQIYCLLDIK